MMYLYKKITTLLLLAMSAFLILCSEVVAQPNGYTTIKLEKYNSKNALLEDIDTLRKSPFVKDPLETKKEFEERKQTQLAKFQGKAYEIHLRINEMKDDDIFQHKKIIAYDPETEAMTIVIPRVEKHLIKIQQDGGGEEDFDLQGIRLLIHEEVEDKRLKNPGEKLGVPVKNSGIIKVYRLGIFMPASGSEGTIYKFTFPMNRNDARSVLKDGELVLRVLVDTEYLEYDATPLLFEEGYTADATAYPLISQVTMYIPARLSYISMNDGNGIEVFQEKGDRITQLNSFFDKLWEWLNPLN